MSRCWVKVYNLVSTGFRNGRRYQQVPYGVWTPWRAASTHCPPETKELLQSCAGGKIELHKNDDTGIADIIFNHPERKNAISGSMMLDLDAIVTELESWEGGRGIVMYGVDKCFCSGGDLKLMSTIMDAEGGGAQMSAFMQDVLTRLFNLPLVSAALVEGQALGGGTEIMTAVDYRVLSERVSVGFVQAKIGLVSGWGGGTRLVDLVGRHRALDLLSSARIMSWKEAMDLGLVDCVLQDNPDFIENGRAWLLKHLPATPHITQAVKQMVTSVAAEQDLYKSLEKERSVFESLFGGEAHRLAMSKSIKHNT